MKILRQGDCLKKLKTLKSNSVDLLCTDPPYGMSFMGKDWDKALPSVEVWRECFRVLKPGAFAFVMSAARLDLQSRMVIKLEEAGFNVGFTPIYWAYASGFPKAKNMSKEADKKAGAEREVVGIKDVPMRPDIRGNNYNNDKGRGKFGAEITAPATDEAKWLDGAFGGFQPKPAVEVIIVAMKPPKEKTFLAQALDNGKAVTWMGDCMIPYVDESDKESAAALRKSHQEAENEGAHDTVSLAPNDSRGGRDPDDEYDDFLEKDGRFPANLLVSDNALDDGKHTVSRPSPDHEKQWGDDVHTTIMSSKVVHGSKIADSGGFSRYFDLDAWAEKWLPPSARNNFPFMIVPKPSKSEKNQGCERIEARNVTETSIRSNPETADKFSANRKSKNNNFHPTVKPLKLMTFLIILGSRPGDTILDPFMGSGTTIVAAALQKRGYIGFELNSDFFKIATARLDEHTRQGMLL